MVSDQSRVAGRLLLQKIGAELPSKPYEIRAVTLTCTLLLKIRAKLPCYYSITGSHVKSEKNCCPDIPTSRSEQSHSANPYPRFSDKSRVTLAIPQNQVELPKAVKFALNAFNEFNCDTNFSTETTIFSKNAVTGSDVRARKCYDDMLSII